MSRDLEHLYKIRFDILVVTVVSQNFYIGDELISAFSSLFLSFNKNYAGLYPVDKNHTFYTKDDYYSKFNG